MSQPKQKQWSDQWKRFSDCERFLFEDWIYPNTLDDFRGQSVLECGCGGGQHTKLLAPLSRRIVAVDLNAVEVAKSQNGAVSNVEFLEDDIATMMLGEKFDIVFSVGVIHHTDCPDDAIQNLKAHILPGGRLIIWVYSREGNWLAENVVERFRKTFLTGRSVESILQLSRILTACLYIPIYTIYKLPIRFLPYFSYFENFRRLNFERNLLNVFDKLNAPQVEFINRARVVSWFSDDEFSDVHIDQYRGISWRASGTYLG